MDNELECQMDADILSKKEREEVYKLINAFKHVEQIRIYVQDKREEYINISTTKQKTIIISDCKKSVINIVNDVNHINIFNCKYCKINLCKVRSGLDLISCKYLTITIDQCPAIDFSKCNNCKVIKSKQENMYIKNWYSIDNIIDICGRQFNLNNNIFDSCKIFKYENNNLNIT